MCMSNNLKNLLQFITYNVYVLEIGLTKYMFKDLNDNWWKKFWLKNLIMKSFLVTCVEEKSHFGT